MRLDTGPLLGSETRAWIAAVRQEATDWVQGSARNEREHVAAKLVSSHGRLDLTSHISYDSIHEDTYQRLYSEGDFLANPRWDRLVGDWPGVPYLNQFYRPGWQTRRNNAFAYLKADWSFNDVTSLSGGFYFHHNRGRGDWLPPYIVDVTDDDGGPESELMGRTPVQGGAQLGLIHFVNRDGVAVGPTPECTSSYIFNYYGSGGPEIDPACHPDATAVQSYRHSHYGKDRVGVTLDEEWFTTVGAAGSTLRAGIWYENSRRDLGRDWHQMLDPTLSFKWNEQALLAPVRVGFPAARVQVVRRRDALRRSVHSERRRQAVPGQGVARGLVWASTRTSWPIPIRNCSSPAASRTRRRSRACTFSADMSKISRRSAAHSSRSRDGASTISNRKPPRTSMSGYSIPGIGLPSVPRDTSPIFRTGFSTSARKRRPVPTISSRAAVPISTPGGIHTNGFEFSATVQMPQQISFYTAYTFNNSEYIGSGDPPRRRKPEISLRRLTSPAYRTSCGSSRSIGPGLSARD